MVTEQATDEAAIRRLIDKLGEGIRAKDLEGLKSVYTPDVVSFDVEPPLQQVGVEGKLRNWAGVFAAFQGSLDYELRELSITVGDGVAFGHSFNRLIRTLEDGTQGGVWVRFTAGFRKVDGEWLIAHDQVSLPVDFATGNAAANLEP